MAQKRFLSVLILIVYISQCLCSLAQKETLENQIQRFLQRNLVNNEQQSNYGQYEDSEEEFENDESEENSGSNTQMYLILTLGGFLVFGLVITVILIMRKATNESHQIYLENKRIEEKQIQLKKEKMEERVNNAEIMHPKFASRKALQKKCKTLQEDNIIFHENCDENKYSVFLNSDIYTPQDQQKYENSCQSFMVFNQTTNQLNNSFDCEQEYVEKNNHNNQINSLEDVIDGLANKLDISSFEVKDYENQEISNKPKKIYMRKSSQNGNIRKISCCSDIEQAVNNDNNSKSCQLFGLKYQQQANKECKQECGENQC